jgi:hypothetical protein
MQNEQRLFRWAFWLSVFTIAYNLVEGVISIYFGQKEETLALFGFGVDSFVEVISGLGIAHMVWRMRHSQVNQRDVFEKRALRITGTAFYILVAGIVFGSVLVIYSGRQPETTLPGLIERRLLSYGS